jgi:hypothetical protein
MAKTISKDTPLSEITLRRYEKPSSNSKRDLTRKVCLSIGLLQPGDSRDIIVDILQVLMENKEEQLFMNSEKIRSKVILFRKKQKLPIKGVAPSNIRRQLKRLRDLYLVETIRNEYRITEFEELHVIFKKQIKEFYLKNILERVEDYFREIK